MRKIININTKIKELATEYPEIKEIMKSLGFENIMNPVMLNTAGKVITLKKGAQMKDIDLNLVYQKFQQHNFILEDN